MSRLLFENDRQAGRTPESAAVAEDTASHGRSGATLDEAAGGARGRGLRDDPSGRRSLTGLEFRRRRSS
jgi:hypothetical protein